MGEKIRDRIRAVTLGANKQFRSKTFEYNGVDIEFREPSHRDRREILARVGASEVKGAAAMEDYIVWSVIRQSYVPGTDEKVFEDGDFDALCDDPAMSGFVDKFWNEISDLVNVDLDSLKKS